MRKFLAALALWALTTAPLPAQRAVAFEGAVFGQHATFDGFTKLQNALGAGLSADVFVLRRLALEYEVDLASTRSDRVGKLTAFNNRINLVYNLPLTDRWRLLAGGGFTGTQYRSDTTLNQFDSGANAVLGLRYCVNENWSWKGSGVMDFKDPSDQTPTGARTKTLGIRIGVTRFFGGQARNGPCLAPTAPLPRPAAAERVTPPVTPPAAPPPAAAAPPPAQPPAAAPPPPAEPQRAAAPVPAPAPARPRELLTLHGAHFAFDKYNLTKAAQDTLNVAVEYLRSHADERLNIEGHTDSIGTPAYNQGLSERRANSVKRYLVSKGVAEGRITTQGFSESKPVADNGTAEGRAQNRRAVLIVIP